MKENIVLIGFMATGKSTIGKRLAERLGWPFVDIDQMIEEMHGKSIEEIFRIHGEEFFRREESNMIALVAKKPGQVIATGGGAVLREMNLKALAENGVVVCLKAEPEVINSRVSGNDRPLLSGVADRLAHIKKLLEERAACYDKADFALDSGNMDADTAVAEIIKFTDRQKIGGDSHG